MKKVLLASFIMFGILGYSQHSKKKDSKNSTKKICSKKKVKIKKTNPPTIVKIKEDPKSVSTEIVQDDNPKNYTSLVQSESIGSMKEDYISIAHKLLNKRGWIHNRNSTYYRGIRAFIKGIYTNNGKIFILVEMDNKTNIPYDILGISFISPTELKGRGYKETYLDEIIFEPIWSKRPEKMERKSKNKMVFVFNKFTIAENRKFQMIMTELSGGRTLTIEINPKYILNAQYVN